MQIRKRFTKGLKSPYEGQTFEARKSEIREPDGRVVFHNEKVMVPREWSQVATDILAQKYFRKTAVPQEGKGLGGEHDARQVFHRLAGCWMDWGKRHGYFDSDKDAQAFYDETCYMLSRQIAAPNSPQWFNTGLHFAYGIDGPAQGHYFVDPKTGELKASTSSYEHPQPHACQPWDALVSTPSGPLPIGRIVEDSLIGREVYDASGVTRVTAVAKRGVKPVLRAVLKNGMEVEATADHVVWVEDSERPEEGKWIELGRVVPGMRMAQRCDTLISKGNADSRSLDEAVLAGWLQADGFVGQYREGTNRSLTVEFMTADDEEFDYLLPIIKRVFEGNHYHVRLVDTQSPELVVRRIRLYGESLRDFVDSYELMDRGFDIRLPRRVLEGGQAALCAYLRSVFQADGTVRCHAGATDSFDVVLGSISELWMKDIQKSLANLGLYSRLNVCRDSRPERAPYFQLSLGYKSERRKFQELIGFLTTEKRNKLLASLDAGVRGKEIPSRRLETVLRVETVHEQEVFDIQTESGSYLSGNIVVHNCFIQSVRDDLVNENGIMDLWVREARLFKYGSGTGTNFSSLRGDGEPLAGGGRSSGLMSFLKVGDRAAGVIKSGGTTRRAAKMVCLDLDHPEVEGFINWKVLEEQKVSALVAGSRIHRKALNALVRACRLDDGAIEADPTRNSRLRKALRHAQELMIPEAYLARALQLAKDGAEEIDFPLFDTDWQSEAYATVSGQNSNNSVRVPDGFFDAIDRDEKWQLKWRTDGRVAKEIPARRLWDQIAYATWACADPAIQCDTTINEWHTCPAGGRINASNPCSEYMFLDDTACNLASINLLKFYDDETGQFGLEDFAHACRIWTIILEISVLMAQFPSRQIAQKSYDYRTLGLGYANLGALLMSMGIPYGSPEATAMTGAITALMTGESYAASAEMAKELGAFPRFADNRDAMLRVIRNHRHAIYDAKAREYESLTIRPVGVKEALCPKPLLAAAREAWDRALELGEKHGYRNAQTTVIAPTGTIGLLMDCDTTGIEPDFALVKFKKLAGGGYFRIINQSVPRALKNLGYPPKQVDSIVEYCIGHGTLKGAPAINPESLKAKGFTPAVLERVEAALASAFEIGFVFSPWTLGEEFCREALGFTEAALRDPEFDCLRSLGFSAEDIQSANDYVCGRMTVEGAPHLKLEHYPIFDCANRCGRYGERFLGYGTHIDMMAAAQPFISGAISKTINMPHEASVDDVKEAYTDAWKKMVKAISIYRDGSKLSQPLNATLGSIFSHLDDEEEEEELLETPRRIQVERLAAEMADQVAGRRRELPTRRFGYTVKATIGGQRVYLRTGEYEDGTIGEIFIDIYKEGAAYRSLMNAFAIAISLGLQYGVPLEEFVSKFHMFRFEPNGHVADHDSIKFCSSIIDFIFRDLALNYLGRADMVHVPPKELAANRRPAPRPSSGPSLTMEMGGGGGASLGAAAAPVAAVVATDILITQEEWSDDDALASRLARSQGYEGDPCGECGQFTMVRSGTCTRCVSCGSTSGCS